MAPTRDQVIATAASQIGAYYPGQSKYGVWYGAQVNNVPAYASAPFCAMGLSWVFAQHQGGLDIFPMHAYTPSGAAWFKARGQWHNGVAGIRRGDIAFFDFGLGRISHVDIVESVNSDGSFNGIDFNTSGTVGGDQRNGRLVARKRRKGYVVGYGRPNYSGTPAPAVNPEAKGYLQQGDFGGAVGDMQRRLAELGYNLGSGGIDLDFGPTTKAALVAFQRSKGLSPDGIYGAKSKAALLAVTSGAEDPKPAPKPSSKRSVSVSRATQEAVRAAPDGYWGDDTDMRVNLVRAAINGNFPGGNGRGGVQGVKDAQWTVRTATDGKWGSNSRAALKATIARLQRAWGVKDDGVWGSKTEAAWKTARANNYKTW